MKKVIASPLAPKAVGPYSQAIEHDSKTLYISGQLPIDGATGKMAEGIEAQTRRSLDNLGHILSEAGYGFGDIAKTTVLLAHISDFAAMNAVYAGGTSVRSVRPDFMPSPPHPDTDLPAS